MIPRWVRHVRRATRHWGLPLVIILAIPFAVAALPFAMIQAVGVERRKLDTACESPCGNCGQELGEAAVHAVDAEWQEIIGRLIQKHGRIPYGVERWFHAICAGCGQHYRYEDRSRSFIPVESSTRLRDQPACRSSNPDLEREHGGLAEPE